MNKLCLFLVIAAIVSNAASGFVLRNKRQANATPSPNTSGPTTQSTAVRDCIRSCPVTSEYNPVCGSNGVTYDNPGRLGCAQACGVTVNLQRASRCSRSVQVN